MDPLLSLSWAAQAAPRLRLGTSVLVAPLRNPVLLAKQVSTLDFLSGGRVMLGLGVGWMREEIGVTHLVVDTPIREGGMDAARREMERVASISSLSRSP